MKPKPPRKIFVMVVDELRPMAEQFLRRLATITAIIPPTLNGYAYRYELENRDWPEGDFNQATMVLHESREGNTVTLKAELVMV
jgi:hypothetical protein